MLYILFFSLPFLFSFPLFQNVYLKRNRNYCVSNYPSSESMHEKIYKDQEKNTTVSTLEIEKFIENLKKIREEEDKWDCGEVEWEM